MGGYHSKAKYFRCLSFHARGKDIHARTPSPEFDVSRICWQSPLLTHAMPSGTHTNNRGREPPGRQERDPSTAEDDTASGGPGQSPVPVGTSSCLGLAQNEWASTIAHPPGIGHTDTGATSTSPTPISDPMTHQEVVNLSQLNIQYQYQKFQIAVLEHRLLCLCGGLDNDLQRHIQTRVTRRVEENLDEGATATASSVP